jgi:phage tail-like protein
VPDRVVLAHTFNFKVNLFLSPFVVSGLDRDPTRQPAGEALVDGAFQECSGLDIEMDVQDYQEGGRNDGVIRRVGRAKYQPLILKRGMFYRVPIPAQPAPVTRSNETVEPKLWQWLQDVVSGKRPVPRYDGIVSVLDRFNTEPVARWFFDRGLPAKIVGPQLNAKTGDVAIEELHIAHEGLRLFIK